MVRGAPGPLEPCTIFGRTCTLPDCDRPCDDAKYWIDAVPAAPYDPHEGVLCCPCVDRLRAQNKASSDEWTKRTAEMTSDLDTLRALMAEAETLNRTDDGIARHGMSQYGRAALAVALQEADDARLELTAMRAQMAKERRMRLYAESKLTRANCLLRAAKEKPDA